MYLPHLEILQQNYKSNSSDERQNRCDLENSASLC
jgi:hypothetical protein